MANIVWSPDEMVKFTLVDRGDGTFAFPTYAAASSAQVAAVASAKATDTIIKASAGQLVSVLVTTTGTNPMQIFDNALAGSGTIIGALPASPAVGTLYTFTMPAANGITVKGNAANPGVTISYL